jgi:hypothetical protein
MSVSANFAPDRLPRKFEHFNYGFGRIARILSAIDLKRHDFLEARLTF